ncbi:hypothetical protein [Sinorhizobium fredii]|uniref:hypothetical protein n=1 Tax=Rhizobium fredii TaxID=380 RepID=UPI0004ADA7CD|nr:hypothetical protein [Sinorhizobium fredii]
MKAKVVKAFPGRPDHEAMTRTIEVGEEIEGELAAVAVREKWAEPIETDEAIGNDADGVVLDKMKVDELKAHATSLGVDLGAAKTKAQIIALIVASTAKAD